MLLETVALSLGSALAKQLIKEWVGDADVLARISTELGKAGVGLLSDAAQGKLKKWREAKQFEKITENIVKNYLNPHFERNSSQLKENSKHAVAIALGITLDSAALTAGDLLDMRLKEDKLVAHLTKKQPKVVVGLNEAERGLYKLLLEKASAEIIKIATTLTGYDPLRDHGLFDDHAKI